MSLLLFVSPDILSVSAVVFMVPTTCANVHLLITFTFYFSFFINSNS